MATLNEMIAQGAQFNIPDPVAQYNKLAQMQRYQQENELARYTMAKAQQEDVTRNALNQAYQSNMNPETGEINYAGVYRNLGAAGAGASIPGIQKTQFEAEQQRQLLAKTRQETSGLQNKAIGSALTTAMSDPSDAGLNQAFDILDRQKIDTKSLRSQLLNISDPAKRLAAIRGYATAHPEGIAAMKFVAPDPLLIIKGDGSKIFIDKNPNSPTFKTEILPSQVAGMTPTQAATVKTGQDQLKVSQDRLAFDREKLKYEQDNPGFTVQAIEKSDGTTEYFAINKISGAAKQITLGVSNLTGVNLPAQTAKIRQKFDQDKLDFERANPGFTIEQVTQADQTIKFKKVNKQTGVATDVMDVSGTPLSGAAKTTLSPLATLQKELAAMPPNSKQADEHRKKILKDITDTSQAQLKLAQDRFAWDKANPGYHIEAINNEDGSQRFVAVNKQTLKAYPITEAAIGSGKPPNIGAPLVGAAAGATPAPVAAQTPGAPAMPGQPVPLTSAKRPSAFAEKAAAQKVQMGKDLTQAITELTDATKDGGLIDQSTGSGAGRLYDVGAGFFGQAPQGAIAIGKLQPIADIALKMVPRFEGPQSDKDTTSYKQAAGQLADPTLPTKIRKEAGKTVLRLMKARKEQFGTVDMVAEGVAPAPAAAAPNIDALLNKYK